MCGIGVSGARPAKVETGFASGRAQMSKDFAAS
jgi:hypothetical protein